MRPASASGFMPDPAAATDRGDGDSRRALDRERAGGDFRRVNLRPLAGIEVAGLQRIKESARLVFLRLHHHPSAAGVIGTEVRVVGGDRRQVAAFIEKLVEERGAIAAAALRGTAVIVDLHRMTSRKRSLPAAYALAIEQVISEKVQ